MGGTGVTTHAYTAAAIRRAVENGVRGVEHGNLLDRDTAKLMGGYRITAVIATDIQPRLAPS
jgi:imidazolonepropionase-like amidohydrolase